MTPVSYPAHILLSLRDFRSLSAINDMGSAVVVSDFGNSGGLLGSYRPILAVAASAYLIALLVIQLIMSRCEPAKV